MKRLFSSIVLWTVLVFVPAPAAAQITDYEGVLGAQEYLNFLNAGQNVVSDWTTESGQHVYVGPYVGAFGAGVTNPSFSIICVDFYNTAGDQWVNVTSLGDASGDADMSLTRLGDSGGSFLKYRQAAYLASLFDDGTLYANTTERRSVWSGIHASIWSLMTGDNIGGGLDNGLLAGFPADFDSSEWYVLSGVDGARQEMLIRGPASTVPEPSAYLLMATGLAFLFVFGRKRMGRLDER